MGGSHSLEKIHGSPDDAELFCWLTGCIQVFVFVVVAFLIFSVFHSNHFPSIRMSILYSVTQICITQTKLMTID
jgi:hypothetical protein